MVVCGKFYMNFQKPVLEMLCFGLAKTPHRKIAEKTCRTSKIVFFAPVSLNVMHGMVTWSHDSARQYKARKWRLLIQDRHPILRSKVASSLNLLCSWPFHSLFCKLKGLHLIVLAMVKLLVGGRKLLWSWTSADIDVANAKDPESLYKGQGIGCVQKRKH